MKMQIRFDSPPGPVSGRFIEVEDAEGQSIEVGEWVRQGVDWLLVIDTDPSHAYCRNCEAIRPVFFQPLSAVRTPNDEGSWAAGDVVCKECAWIVATLYVPEVIMAERR